MSTATITVKYVNAPKEGKKKGTIKTVDGQMYGVWADKLSSFQPNGVYEIEYTSEEWNGQTYHTVKSATSKGSAPPTAFGRRPGGNTYRETSLRDAERMFVCSILNAFIQAGQVKSEPGVIEQHINMLRDVWHETFGADPTTSNPPSQH